MVSYNIIMLILAVSITCYMVFFPKASAAGKGKVLSIIDGRRFELVFVTVVVVIGAVLRLYLLDSAPAGFNQDEASIGYDSWAIANFGMDR
ncbi:MAG: hypothetical protein HGA22_03425, partial [Clostridiales bacterium]|nr:hypothetical protein [Clostridiales bacterium]